MPQVRKLTPEEVYALDNKAKGQRKMTEDLYDTILADYMPGDYGEADLEATDNRLTVRNRLRAAAKRRGVAIHFHRTNGSILRFQVVEGSSGIGKTPIEIADEALAAPVSSEAPPKRRGGRQKASEKGAMDRLESIAGKVQDAAKGALENIGLRKPETRKGGRPKKSA